MPDAVDENAADERIVTRDEPLGESEAIALGALGKCSHGRRDIGVHRFANRAVILAAQEHLGRTRFVQFTGHEGGSEALL